MSYEVAQTKEQIHKSDTFNLSDQFNEMTLNSYTNPGIRKTVLLTIYSDFLQSNLAKFFRFINKIFS